MFDSVGKEIPRLRRICSSGLTSSSNEVAEERRRVLRGRTGEWGLLCFRRRVGLFGCLALGEGGRLASSSDLMTLAMSMVAAR